MSGSGGAAWTLALLVAAPLAHAAPKLLDKSAIVKVLAGNPPCCVVDARGQQSRAARPLKDAVVYRPALKINPTATVVVVADSDQRAIAVARALDKAHPGKPIVGVKGGFPVWESILLDRAHEAGAEGGMTFVIPRNTCEQDTPLQIMKRGAP
jgi:hypothetical protein